MQNPFLYIQTVLFQIIQFNISTQFKCQNSSISIDSTSVQFFVYIINVKTVIFQTIQFGISILFSSTGPKIGPNKVLLLRARVDFGECGVYLYCHCSQDPALQELHDQIV